jgi:predicted metal-binding membrane protein
MNSPALLEKILKRDRWIVLAGLVINMPMVPKGITPWSAGDVFWLFLMWAVMMVAMMTPSAVPLILTYAVIHRKRFDQKDTFSCTVIFLSGYLAIWTAFSLIAALIQWGLHAAALLSPMMISKSVVFSGGLLIVAGIYQWMPLKQTCLAHCRSPVDFFMTNWRNGKSGAFSMGIYHGAFCTGCCWHLMALLFVAGVMTLWWVAAIATLVLIEKIFPGGPWLGRVTGILLVGWGLWIFSSSYV